MTEIERIVADYLSEARTEKPRDTVERIVADFLVEELTDRLGREPLRDYTWAGDDDPDGSIVIADSEGRRFEIEVDVWVSQLKEDSRG